jgi:hypothetical protein
VRITVGATDAAGHRAVSAIDVRVDGNAIGAVSGASGSLTWDTRGAAAGAHTVEFRARLSNWSGSVSARQVNLALQAPQPAGPSSGPNPWDVGWLPSDRDRVVTAINAIIVSPETGGSPRAGLKDYGATILKYSLESVEGNPAGVNPAFALAMFRKEANFATYGAAPANNNPGNIVCAGGTRPLYGATRCNGRFGVYASMEAGIKAYFWLLQAEYKPGGAISRNCPDIPCIIRAYAPASENDTERYIVQVTDWTRDFQNRIASGTPPPPPPSPPPPPTRPDAPTLASPGNGSSWQPSTEIVLRWNSSANATQYKVELWGERYSRMTPCDWQSGTSCRIGTMWAGAASWRVQARNASGQESDWSDTWSFTIQAAPTDTPTRTATTYRPPDTPTPTATTRHPTDTPTVPPAPGDLRVVAGLDLSTTSPTVGDRVTAYFKLRNVGGSPVYVKRLVAGARGPNARSQNWNAPNVDFPAVTDLTLQPGQEYDYRQSRTFDRAGDYFAEPAWMDASDHWEGVLPYPRVWFNVVSRPASITPSLTPSPTRTRTPTVPSSPGRLVLVEGLSVSNTNPQVNQSVNARFRVRNDGGQPITARFLGVKGRHSSGASYDFHWIENLTFQPGQEYTYDTNRSFDRTGSYSLTPNWNDGSNWQDIKFANGSSNYVTINVSAQPPTVTPTTSVGPTGNLARNARREPDGIGSGNAFDGNLSTFWTNGLGHRFNLRLTLAETATVNRIIVWDRPQNSPDNQQINALIISLSNGWSKRFDMISGGPRCIDVTLNPAQRISWVNLKADDASGNNGLSEVEIWAGSKTTGISCSNKGGMP